MGGILQVDTIQNNNTSNLITQTNVTTITIGVSGQTISIPSGATLTNNGTASGFGLTWQSVQTTGFTAVKGNAYPCNTTSAGFTVTLPATPSVGDQIQVVDYAGTFDTNALVINPNGNKIESGTLNLQLTGEREGVILTYIDSTQGWLATSGINEGTDALAPVPYSINYLIVAGGGGGGGGNAGGGGAGGLLSGTTSVTPLTVYSFTVGAGGASVTGQSNKGNDGANSTGFSLTSTGGGGGGTQSGGQTAGKNGGSGGGGAYQSGAGGTGTAGQGNNGGTGASNTGAGAGGGGASAVGGNGGPGDAGGAGGAGTASSITGSSVTYAGGGGGGSSQTPKGSGGSGGGGNGAQNNTAAVAGTVNTGGGGGGGCVNFNSSTGAAGGSGVVILSVPTANYSGTTTGSPTVTTSGSNTIIKFTGSGSYTA